MIAPIRVVVNKHLSNFSAIQLNTSMSVFPFKIIIDISNGNIKRRRSNLSSKSTSRSSLILSNTSSIPYYKCMEINSKKLENINIESSQLSFADNSNSGTLVSRMADNSPANRSKHIPNEAPASVPLLPPHSSNNNISESNNSKQSSMNVNLSYNINQAIDQDT